MHSYPHSTPCSHLQSGILKNKHGKKHAERDDGFTTAALERGRSETAGDDFGSGGGGEEEEVQALFNRLDSYGLGEVSFEATVAGVGQLREALEEGSTTRAALKQVWDVVLLGSSRGESINSMILP
jgi:hypothetical protein